MKLSPLLLLLALSATASADPQISSWLTDFSTKYARIYTSDANKNAGNSVTTWSNTRSSQSLPAYCGVQEISSSTSWVYVRTTGLASYVMGPWYNNAARTVTFVNIPTNQRTIYRIPRVPVVPATKVNVQGEIGFFVDGVHAFDSSDAVSYSNSNARDGDAPGTPNGVTGDGIWNRDAYINEAITFDNALAHQQNTGVYHYHANPIGLRHLLGDHVDFNPSTKAYSESTTPVTSHSPIVGWAKDGYPIYGPYGYSSRLDPNSGVRRMVTGYVPRNGQNSTTNLATTGRTSLPAWAKRVQNRQTLTSTQYGPTVSTSFPLGRYLEDNDYLGDLGKVQGTDFDLDEHNGRTCVTPEFPSGTYAYFVAITTTGAPAFPYNLGKRYYGTPSGNKVTSINETVTTHFSGGPNITEEIEPPTVSANGNDVTLTWSSVEGGTYRLEATNDLATYSTVTTKAAATNATTTSAAESGAAGANPKRFYRITRTALASYDPVSTTAAAATASGSAEPQTLSTTSTAAEAPTATAVSTKKSRPVSRRTLRSQK